jgi:hypothetical protein|tara:strand:- start:1665 stop:2087 length:423 start_codon:yes stop_codon:yes gene_type:complete
MINLDNIFHLFGPDDNFDGVDNGTTYMDFKSTPTYWVGMYKKLILNHINFNKKIIKFFQKSDKALDLGDVKEAGEFVTYNRAWSYIKKIDVSNKEHIKGIKVYADEYLDTALKLGISFFIETEQYERCAHLQKILDSLSE